MKPGARVWWTLGVAVLAVVLFALYEQGRSLATKHAPTLLEQLAVVALLSGGAAVLAGALMQRQYRQGIRDLSRRIMRLQKAAAPAPLRPLPDDFQPLTLQLDLLCSSYRQKLLDRESQSEALATLRREAQQTEAMLQSLLGKADAEKGRSHSLVYRTAPEPVSHEMIARLDPRLCWMAATPALQQLLGYGPVDLTRRIFTEIVHPEDTPGLTQTFQQILSSGEGHNITFRVHTRAGKERYLQMDALTRYRDDGTPLHLRCHFLDITQKVITEQELRRRTEQLSQANHRLQSINRDLERLKESYRDLYHHAPVMYFSIDAKGSVIACNETMLRTLGHQPADLFGQPYTKVLTPEAARRFQQQPGVYQQAAEIEAQWLKQDGQALDVWIRTVPVHDSDGQFLRSRSAAHDVTERNRLANALRAQAEELQRTNDQLRRINRELDDFTYVVSHDLKEPLRTLQVFGDFLAQDYGKQLGSGGQEYISHLTQASRRLGCLIDDLLTLSRAGRVLNTPQVFDLADTVAMVCTDLASLIQRRGATVRIEGLLPAVVGDQQRMTQLLSNLVSNGLKYNTNPKPEVVIGAANTDCAVRPAQATVPIEAGDPTRALIYVRDNGIGIDPRYHEQIFGIFRRLHLPEEYEGTGAGLAICKKIVEAHGGRIWVESSPGQGATFYFTVARPALDVQTLAARASSKDTMKLRLVRPNEPIGLREGTG